MTCSRWAVAAAVAVALSLGGCGGSSDDASGTDLCAQYDEAAAAVQELRSTDLAARAAAHVREDVEQVQASLDQLQEVAGERVDDAITRLQTSLDEVAQAAVDAGEEARQEARSLVEGSADDVARAWAAIEAALETRCGEPPAGEGE